MAFFLPSSLPFKAAFTLTNNEVDSSFSPSAAFVTALADSRVLSQQTQKFACANSVGQKSGTNAYLYDDIGAGELTFFWGGGGEGV